MFLISHNSLSNHTRRFRCLATVAAALLAVSAGSMTAIADDADTAQTPRLGAMDNDHLKRVIEFVMARIAEPQKEQVEQLAKTAFAELETFEREAEDVRAPRGQILLADVVDRAALERARVAELHIADTRSRRVDHLLIDVAGVLTPKQRVQLRAEMTN